MAAKTSSKTRGTRKTAAKTPTDMSAETSAEIGVETSAETDVENTPPPAAAAPVKVLGKRELVDRVVAASGIKKKAAKPVVEAMLKELGDALSREEALNLQPFGKASIKRNKDMPNAEVIELRLRRSKLAVQAAEASAQDPAGQGADPGPENDVEPGADPARDPLAEPAE